MNFSSAHTRLMHIKFRAIKSSAIIKDGNHVLQRIMCLQKHTLVAFYGIRSAMSLAESISCKAFNLPPHFFRSRICVSFFFTVVKKFFFYFLKFSAGAVFAAHASAQHVRFAKG